MTLIAPKDKYLRADFKKDDTLRNELNTLITNLENSEAALVAAGASVSSTLIAGESVLAMTQRVLALAREVWWLAFVDPAKFSQLKAQRIITGVQNLHNQQDVIAPNTQLLGSVRPKLDVVTTGASRRRIVTLLEGKRTAGAVTFEDVDTGGGGAQAWTFGPHGTRWTINIAAGADETDGAVADAVARTVTLTVGNGRISTANSTAYEAEIANLVTTAYRRAERLGGVDDALRRGSAAAALTDSDRENLFLLATLYSSYEAARLNLLAAPNAYDRQKRAQEARSRLRKKIVELGLDDDTKRGLAVGEIPHLLVGNDVKDGLKDTITAEAGLQQFRTYTAARGGPDPETEQTKIITPELIGHLVEAAPRGYGEHRLMGISGGHDDARLRAFVASNPLYHIVETTRKTITVDLGHGNETLTVRKYDQYRWNQPGFGLPPGTGDAAVRPGGGAFQAARWSKSDVPKTTVDNLSLYLHLGASAYRQWVAGNAVDRTNVEGEVSGPDARSAVGGVRYTAYVRTDPIGGLKKLETLFPDSAYIDSL